MFVFQMHIVYREHNYRTRGNHDPWGKFHDEKTISDGETRLDKMKCLGWNVTLQHKSKRPLVETKPARYEK